MMQGQSSRVPKSPPRKSRDPGLLLGNSRIGKFDVVDSVPDDIELDFDQDDEMVPWLNYPIEDDALAQLPEISSLTAQNSFPSAEKKSSCGQNVSNLYTCSSSALSSSSKSHMLSSWQPGTSNAVGQQQQPISNLNLMNFSHFARPDKTLVKSNFSNPDAIPTVSSVLERMEIREKGSSPASGSNLVKKSAFVDRFNITRKDVASREPVFNAAAKGLCPTERSKHLCVENAIKNDKPVIQSMAIGFLVSRRIIREGRESFVILKSRNAIVMILIRNLWVRKNRALVAEVVDRREAEQQKYIIFPKG
ncbi:hypothetical protein MIMGU_mgv1a010665mg [Erythranthe guttata]|uniref:Uncharacterized protein n=1 Tax=Erythranthe guttata TaxID=4155 RepID=A0A022PUA3_ERYGU|nr:hypothetical protein MIMGU_mgv1a010665mg [Erythranthe guttata]